ncbi:hypothetical protein LX36DRAFT_582755 [Colletotrichum falcatum]|nr:hypothetical protein LX36DRAFT_582755 [Colletotrichum falcatum]
MRLGTSHSNLSITATTILQNTRDYKAKQVVQLYVSYPKEANEIPKLLRGF